MVNRPKAIGTKAETLTLKFLRLYFPGAQREVLHGGADEGDITNCGDFIFEVKAGKQCLQIGDVKLSGWMREARVEAENRGVPHGFLVTQRAGMGEKNVHRWWIWVDLPVFAELLGGYYFTNDVAPVRLELGVFIQMLADRGHIAEPDTAAPIAV